MAITSTKAEITTTAGKTTDPPDPTTEQPRPRHGGSGAYYVMLLPVLVIFTGFIIVPAVLGFGYSFTDFVGYGSFHFIGLTNYAALFSDPNIRTSYGFTLAFALVTTVLVNVVALGIALGLASRIKFKLALRGIFFIPMVISGLVIAYVFNYLFSTSLPSIATAVGLGPLQTSVLTTPGGAFVAIVLVSIWQGAPGAIIIYLAGLLAIPEDVYEAGELDGASGWRRFRFLTLPLVAGYLVINTILGFRGFLNAYEIVVALTDGGPGTSTMTVAMTIFTGFTNGDYAYQMANAFIFFLVAVLFSIAQLRLIRTRGVTL